MTRLEALLARARGEEVEVPEPVPPVAPVQTAGVESHTPTSPPTVAIIHDSNAITFAPQDMKRLRRWIYAAGIPLHAVEHVYGVPCTVPEGVQVIVPLGNESLAYFIGEELIALRRGSVYRHGTRWVIPTLSPLIVRGHLKGWERRCFLDWQRIATFLNEPPKTLPHSICVINPTSADIAELWDAMDRTGYLSVDIETQPSEGRIVCVGFSATAGKGLCLEWTEEWIPTIRDLCGSYTTKVLWNHLYDRFWLTEAGVPLNGTIVDGMALLHTLMPTDYVSLAFAASTETYYPYWKDQDKTNDDKTAEENWQQFKTYNCLDAIVAFEITLTLIDRVKSEGMWTFYENHYAALYEPMLSVMLSGVNIDQERRRTLLDMYMTKAREHRDALAKYNGGFPLFTFDTLRDRKVWEALQRGEDPYETVRAKTSEITKSLERLRDKTVSTARLKRLLYEEYGITPLKRYRGEGNETDTLDIFALRQLAYDYRDNPDTLAIIHHALEHTRNQKLATFVYGERYDDDGRMRFSLKFLTEIGRLASSASPRGKRVNSQNIPREKAVRSLIIPEPGHVILQVDLSAAEARVCYVLTKDPELVELARKPSTEYDQHRHTCVIVGMTGSFDETPENYAAVTREARQVGKVINHAAQRSAQAFTISQTLLRNNQRTPEGHLFSEAACEEALSRYHRRFPAIRYWHARVRGRVRRERLLVNTWGRRWPVPYDNPSDELWRRSYSVSLASEIADLLNQWGFRAVHEFIVREGLRSRVLLQEHDGLVLSCPPEEVYDIALFLRDSLERERDYFGVELAIPCEFQVGPAWGMGQEWKALPSRKVMDIVVRSYLP